MFGVMVFGEQWVGQGRGSALWVRLGPSSSHVSPALGVLQDDGRLGPSPCAIPALSKPKAGGRAAPVAAGAAYAGTLLSPDAGEALS